MNKQLIFTKSDPDPIKFERIRIRIRQNDWIRTNPDPDPTTLYPTTGTVAVFNPDLLQKTRNKYLQTEERKRSSLMGHHQILNAIQMGDGGKARRAMRI